MQEMKNSFILYCDQGEQVEMLSDEEAGRLIKALFRFAADGEESRLESGMTRMCFSFISAQIARDKEKYNEKCKRLSENAKKKSPPASANDSNCNQMQANGSNCRQMPAIEGDTDTETETVTDTDTDTVTDPVTVAGTGTDTDTDACAQMPAAHSVPDVPYFPILSEQDREELMKKGIPEAYIEERRKRAELHAEERRIDAAEVIKEWWRTDRGRAPWNRGLCYIQNAVSNSSFDLDDFFQAALQRGFSNSGSM